MAQFWTLKFKKSLNETHAGFYAELTSPNTLSGSPVFNKDKQVVGIVSKYIVGCVRPTTFVSVIYPILVNKVNSDSSTSKEIEPYLLYDLIGKGIIKCVNTDRIQITHNKIEISPPKSLKE